MDAELQQLLREIEAEVPDTAQALRMLLSGGMSGALGSGWIRAIAESIVEMARRLPPGVADKILRALAMILRVLGRQMPTFFGGALTGGAAGGAAAGAGGAAAGSGAGTAVGTGLQIAPGAAEAGAAGAGVTIGAAVFMLFAIGVMTYRTYRELTAELGVGERYALLDGPGKRTVGGYSPHADHLCMVRPDRQPETGNWRSMDQRCQNAQQLRRPLHAGSTLSPDSRHSRCSAVVDVPVGRLPIPTWSTRSLASA